MQRQVAALLKKREPLRRRIVVEQGKVIRPQIADEMSSLIGDRKCQVYFIDRLRNGCDRRKEVTFGIRKSYWNL